LPRELNNSQPICYILNSNETKNYFALLAFYYLYLNWLENLLILSYTIIQQSRVVGKGFKFIFYNNSLYETDLWEACCNFFDWIRIQIFLPYGNQVHKYRWNQKVKRRRLLKSYYLSIVSIFTHTHSRKFS
jgi:hypothetical protein